MPSGNHAIPVTMEVDPGTLRLPAARVDGADPEKLRLQIARFGAEFAAMPPVWVYRGRDGELVIFDGVTWAMRAFLLRPGIAIQVEVVGDLPAAVGRLPTVKERLP